MAVAVRTSATFSVTVTPLTVTVPAAVQAGDVMWLLVAYKLANTITTPTGWTLLAGPVDSSSASALRGYLYRRVATAADTGGGVSYDFALGGANQARAVLLACSGVNTTTPEDLTATLVDGGATAVTAHPVAAVTTVTGNARPFLLAVGRGSTSVALVTWTAPTGYTVVAQNSANSSGQNVAAVIASADASQATAGTTGAKTLTASTASWPVTGFLVARPAAAVTGGFASVRSAGGWVNATPHVRVAGAWTAATAYVRRAGAWVLTGAPASSTARFLTGCAANVDPNTGATAATLNTFLYEANRLGLGPNPIRRSFDSGMPTNFSGTTAGGDANAGVRSFFSCKAPVAEITAGTRDDAISSLVAGMPPGTYFTMWHEPENDMQGPAFVNMISHVYDVVKAANPDVKVGPVHMSYWYETNTAGNYVRLPGAASTANGASWRVPDAKKDFTGVDTYTGNAVALAPNRLQYDNQFQGFWANTQPYTVKPISIAEYGVQDPNSNTATVAGVIADDAVWCKTQPLIDMVLFWQGTGDQGNWQITSAEEIAAWKDGFVDALA